MVAKQFRPTKAQRDTVVTCLGNGMPIAEIAKVIVNPATGKGLSINTLRKKFAEEILSGRTKYYAFVVSKLHNKIAAGDTAAILFWLKCQGGWNQERGAPETPLLIARALELVGRSLGVKANAGTGDDDDTDLAPGRLARAYYQEAQEAPAILEQAAIDDP